MSAFLTIAIIAFSNSLFYLFWWTKVDGKFNTSDLGILLILVSLFILLLKTRGKQALFNPISFLLIFHLLFCLFHICFVIYRFNYPVFDAIVATRSYLYYLSFFVFYLLIDTRKKANICMNSLSIMMIIICMLSVINYFGPVIFHHEWGAGHYTRSGIKRAFIPGLYVLPLVSVWSFACMYNAAFSSIKWNFNSALCIAAQIFTQGRMGLAGVLLALFGIGIQQRRLLFCGYAAFMVLISAIFLHGIMDVNILGENLSLTIAEIQHTKGSANVRMVFLKASFDEFMESPVIGTGGSAIRAFRGAYSEISREQFFRYYILGKQSDIGIFNWIKDFGLVGLAWFIVFFTILARYARRALHEPKEDKRIALFCAFHLVYILFTSLTFEHMINTISIPPVMLTCAFIVRMHYGWNEDVT